MSEDDAAGAARGISEEPEVSLGCTQDAGGAEVE